jgi:hypothetical protein
MLRHSSIAIALLLFLAAAQGLSQTETVEYKKVFSVRTLSGIVHDHSPSEQPVKGAKVEEMSEGWTTTLNVVFTDERGFFSIPTPLGRDTHYLRLSAYGFNPVQIKVHLSRWARRKSLSIPLPVAT